MLEVYKQAAGVITTTAILKCGEICFIFVGVACFSFPVQYCLPEFLVRNVIGFVLHYDIFYYNKDIVSILSCKICFFLILHVIWKKNSLESDKKSCYFSNPTWYSLRNIVFMNKFSFPLFYYNNYIIFLVKNKLVVNWKQF